mmetsp:Transcript_72689/g.229718  ORF Transcript_72689/g.229718 Transcript_72689/m.229718 type:complete len:361 (-) Transcript_72689:42-1124(-)
MLRELEEVREAAVHRAIDPISLEDLRNKPDQVGALSVAGRRVEPALYHRGSVLDVDGELLLRGGLSPFTQEPVDGFLPAPPLSDLRELIRFLDWNDDGWLSISDVAIGLAALLPVDEEGAEHFVRDHLDVDQDGLIADEALRQQIEPYCGERLTELLVAAPVTQVPELRRRSSREELLRWFSHWDAHGSGMLDLPDFQFALVWTMYRAIGDSADLVTKETVSSLFLAELGIAGGGQVSRERFLELFAPVLQANMPEGAPGGEDSEYGGGGAVPRNFVVKVHGPVEGKTLALKVAADDKAAAAVQAELAKQWAHVRRWRLYISGQLLDEGVPAEDLLRWLHQGTALQALPAEASGSSCVVA